MEKNNELKLALDFVRYTNKNIFLTGKAGTGKTTFLKSLKTQTQKRMVVVAPTGVAAINAGGVTIHSFFQLGFGPLLSERVTGEKIKNPNQSQKINKRKINILKSLDLIVIDEISMVRADVLDAIDDVMRRYKNRFQPFGGVQVLMIGDMQQLPPVVKHNEMEMLRKYYKSMYFFHAKALSNNNLITIELKHVYRQSDTKFVDILNEIRNNQLSQESYNKLHERYIPNFKPQKDEKYINLTTHNNTANKINQEYLQGIKSKSYFFNAEIKGNFSEHSYPTDEKLELKVGCQVMFVKNDSSPEKLYYNGKIGEITQISEDGIEVVCPGEEPIEVHTETWENVSYKINTKNQEIEEEFVGSFTQIPLRLAWAITIHKSQGLTFEKAIIDAQLAFSHGQTYVALSRCKSLEGLVLSQKIPASAIICDREISQFNQNIEEQMPDEKSLQLAKKDFQYQIITDIFSYKELSYWLERTERNWEDNRKSLEGNLAINIEKIQKETMPNLIQVGQSFLSQVKQLDDGNLNFEENPKLLERFQKAGSYFEKQHQDHILSVLKVSNFESDNKKAKSAIQEGMGHIMDILEIKQVLLKELQSGFSMTKLIQIRATASLKKEKEKTKFTSKSEVETKHPQLYSLLKYWRNEEAEMLMKPHYMIATTKSLIGISNELPCTKKQLLSIKGFGKAKVDAYGDDIIDMVNEYIEEKGLERPEDPEPKIKKPKIKNHELSYAMFKEGKTIEEIAEKQGFVSSTIQGHLSKYVENGKIAIEELMDISKAKKISEYWKEHEEATLSEAYHFFEEKYGWNELRMARSYYLFLKANK